MVSAEGNEVYVFHIQFQPAQKRYPPFRSTESFFCSPIATATRTQTSLNRYESCDKIRNLYVYLFSLMSRPYAICFFAKKKRGFLLSVLYEHVLAIGYVEIAHICTTYILYYNSYQCIIYLYRIQTRYNFVGGVYVVVFVRVSG
jgi:hypothetical protein